MDENINFIDWLTLALVIIGAINWGLVGLGFFFDGNWNLVSLLFGGIADGLIEATVYLLVGLSGIYQIYFSGKLYDRQREM